MVLCTNKYTNLNGTGVLTNIANLNASEFSNIATVAGDTTEIGQLAPVAK